jgi:hypothetical protein
MRQITTCNMNNRPQTPQDTTSTHITAKPASTHRAMANNPMRTTPSQQPHLRRLTLHPPQDRHVHTRHNHRKATAPGHHLRHNETGPYHQRADRHLRPLNMPEHEDNNPLRLFTIRQQNTNKSLLSQLDLLESLKRDDYDVCAIQEPYIDFNGKSRANHQWTTVYPDTHHSHPDSTRSLLLINDSS